MENQNNHIFANPGRKIQTLSIVITVILAVMFFIAGMFLFGTGTPGLGFLIWVAGGISCYISGLMLYGLGSLIDNQQKLAEDISTIKLNLRDIKVEMENSGTENHFNNQ